MATPKDQSLKTVGRTSCDHCSWIPLTTTCSSAHLLDKTTIMADKSPAKFPKIDDPEAMELRLDLQMLTYSCTDSGVTRQEHQQRCAETSDKAMTMVVRLTRKYRALRKENSMLRKIMAKQDREIQRLKNNSHHKQQHSTPIPNDITDEDMMAIQEPTDTDMVPLVYSTDEQDTQNEPEKPEQSP
ncbi:hypothetical protein ABVT39_008042 [Epinephelus coioides]